MRDRRQRRAETRAAIADFEAAITPPQKEVRKRRRRKPILKRNPDAEDAVRGASMEILRDTMSAEIRAWMSSAVPEGKRRFLLLQQDTGVGKTETTLADVEFMIHVSPHGGLADEGFARATEMGNSAMRWRARSWGWEQVLEQAGINPEVSGISDQGRETLINLCFPESDDMAARAMCAFHDQAERLVQRGYQISEVLCRRCPARAICKVKGYLSQFARAAETDQLFISLPDLQLVSDSGYQNWAELVDPECQKVAVIDDVNAENLAPVRTVTLSHVNRLLKERDGDGGDGADLSPGVAFLYELQRRMGEWKSHKKSGDGAAAADTERAFRDFIDKTVLYPVVRELARIPLRIRVREDVLEDIKSGERFSGRALLPCGDSARLVDVLEKWIYHREPEKGDVLEEEIGDLIFGPDAIDVAAVRARLSAMPLRFSLLEDVIDELVGGAVFPPPTLKKMRDEMSAVRWWEEDAIGKDVMIFMSGPKAFGAGLITAKNAPMVVDASRGWAAALQAGDKGFRFAFADNGDVKLEIALRPRLNFDRSIASSATSKSADFKAVLGMGTGLAEVIDEIDFKTSGGERAEWKSGCRVYQISTARFTNTSFFKKSGGAVTGPGPRLRDAVDLICKQAEREQVLVIGRSDLQAESLRAETERLFSHENVSVRNYAEIVGLDNFSSFGAVVLFLPTPGPEELMSKALRLYRAEFHEMDFETRVDGEVSIPGIESVQMPIYKDSRVERLARDAITSDFYQGAMRLRPNLLEGKAIIILSAYPIEDLTNRADTVFFDWEDAKAVQDIRDVRPEPEIEDFLAWGMSIADIAEAMGVSKRQAYRHRGGGKNAERDKEILRRARAGETFEVIGDALGVSKSTVSRVVKKHK